MATFLPNLGKQISELWEVVRKLQLSINNNSVPTGVILIAPLASAPSGWLICDGSLVSRTAYASLFTYLGTFCGAGDGSTTFGLPNIKGRVVVGVDAAQIEFDMLGKTGGEKIHLLDSTEMPSHTHVMTFGGALAQKVQTSAIDGTIVNRFHFANGVTDLIAAATGGGLAHNNLQPYTAMYYIIKT